MANAASVDLRCLSARCFCGLVPGCGLSSVDFPEALVGLPSSPDMLGGDLKSAATESQLQG